MRNALRTNGLMKTYSGFTLGPLDLTVPTGTVAGIVGSNGAGKTTLIKCLLGLTTADSGTLEVLDAPIARPEDMPGALKERIGVVLDTCAFTQESRVRDVAQLGRAAYRSWDQARFEELTRAFGLDGRKQVKELSRGMGMKLSLAFALAHCPQLLILDEATAGLDPLARDEMLELLRAFMEDETHTVLMASHITSDLEKLADQIICLDAGRIAFDLPKDAICDDAGIVRLRAAQLEELANSAAFAAPNAEGVRVMHEAYSVNMLVPDRFAFADAFPDIPVERASLESYLTLALKGEAL